MVEQDEKKVFCPNCKKDLGKINFKRLYLCDECSELFYIRKKPPTILDYINIGNRESTLKKLGNNGGDS